MCMTLGDASSNPNGSLSIVPCSQLRCQKSRVLVGSNWSIALPPRPGRSVVSNRVKVAVIAMPRADSAHVIVAPGQLLERHLSDGTRHRARIYRVGNLLQYLHIPDGRHRKPRDPPWRLKRSRIPFHKSAITSDAENIRTLNSGRVSVVNDFLVRNGPLDAILELEFPFVSIKV